MFQLQLMFFDFAIMSNTAAYRAASLKAVRLVQSTIRWSNLQVLPIVLFIVIETHKHDHHNRILTIFQSRDVNKLFSFQVEFTEKHALGREESRAVSFSSDLAYGRDQWVRRQNVLAKLKSLKSYELSILNLIHYHSILQLMSPSIDLSGLEENSSNRLEGDTSERRTTFIPLSMKTLSASEWNKASWLQITSDLGMS